ncbi:MAG: DUF6042 family protein [Nocardioides sp.]
MTPDEKRASIFNDVYLHLGWQRQLPDAAISILLPLVQEGPLSLEELERNLRPEAGVERGWESSAWSPLEVWTDEELRSHREELGGNPLTTDGGEPADAQAVMAEEARHRAEHISELDAYSEALGVPSVRTMGNLLEFMVACGILERSRVGDQEIIELNASAPLPGEVLPLSEARQRTEDELRWRDLHEDVAQDIIALFDPHGTRLEQLRTSLERLAKRLGVDAETSRGGVQNLLADGDFTTTADLSRLKEHQVFELTVDWEQFDRSRISIQ